jgi:hypothetical protein
LWVPVPERHGVTQRVRAFARAARREAARRARRFHRDRLEHHSKSTVIVTEYPARARVRWGWGKPAHAGIDAIFAAGRDGYGEVLDGFERHLPDLRAIPRVSDDPRTARWENEYFSGLDAVALYHFIRERRPSRYLEVGSGHSTRFARRAIDDGSLATTISSVDPVPRAEIDDLCDTVHRVGLERAPLELFDDLHPGDVVLLDGSHVAYMNSDVVVAFTEVLPRLPAGVLVGIDDIFLPWDYPKAWVPRWYAEQYLLAVLLLSGDPAWRVVFPGWWVSNDPALGDRVARFEDPARAESGTIGKTFWMERVSP